MSVTPKGRLADVTGKNVSITPEAHYDDWAKTYDADLLDEYGYCAHRIGVQALAASMTDTNARIIDVGCGTGLVGKELRDRGYRNIDGLDVSSKMLQQAEKLGIYQQLIHLNAEKESEKSARIYDAAISIGTFGMGHMGPTGMSKVSAHARPGGLIVLFMNAEPFVDMNFQAEVDRLIDDSFWQVLAIEDHNYMDALERPGKLIVARTSG